MGESRRQLITYDQEFREELWLGDLTGQLCVDCIETTRLAGISKQGVKEEGLARRHQQRNSQKLVMGL